jgi:ABC-2 type transport system permease protein
MSAPTLTGSAPVTATMPAGVGRAVRRLAVRQIARGAVVVVAVAAGMSALVAATYRTVMADAAAVGALDALAANPAIRTLFGEPQALDDPGGFTVWRTATVAAVLLGAWSIFATTRITRGEEEAGRWDLLGAGRAPLRSLVAWHLLVVGAVSVVVAAAIWTALVITGTSAAGAAVHATGVAALGLFFVGVGGLAAQVLPARSSATGAALALLGVTLLARMVADGVPVLAWLRWLSPFGLLELSRPYAGNHWLPLLVLAAGACLAVSAAVTAAGHRDVRDGLIAPAVGRAPRTRLLGSVETFAVRRALRPLAGFSAGIGAYFLLIGLIAITMTEFLTENPAFADAAAQAGFPGLGSVEGYAATLFAILAMPVGGFAADRIAAFARAEADRRLTLIAAQPVRRTRLLGAEVTATAGGAVLLAAVAGLATWLGVALTGGGLTLPATLAGAGNVLPVVLLSLGAAVLALGWMPRATAAVGGVPTVGGFLLQVTAESAGAPQWIIDISPFTHLAPVPVAGPNWPAIIIMTSLALALAGAGAAGFQRRDLRV